MLVMSYRNLAMCRTLLPCWQLPSGGHGKVAWGNMLSRQQRPDPFIVFLVHWGMVTTWRVCLHDVPSGRSLSSSRSRSSSSSASSRSEASLSSLSSSGESEHLYRDIASDISSASTPADSPIHTVPVKQKPGELAFGKITCGLVV